MKVAIQGEPASYHSQAAEKFFGKDMELLCCKNFKATFTALAAGKADRAVMAIENSLYGSINEVYDLLLQHKTWIEGEVYLHIQHCLLGLPGTTLRDVKEVHSQAQALAQCEDYLDTRLPHAARFEEYDTAGSVQLIQQRGDRAAAAIASKQASEMYGLQVLARNIETHRQNYTRFVVLRRDKKIVPDASKTSIVITMASDTLPGSLQHALQAFASRNINLTMLQSRPITGRAWHYLFYIDIGVGLADKPLGEAMKEMKQQGCHVDILGTYAPAKT
ncbi:MAG TPA: prephenate dehydratase [Candidatus Saccharimonadales bacterium]|nr:prephenate dehydratase [Candidatus Saccharimonadales bacterium]